MDNDACIAPESYTNYDSSDRLVCTLKDGKTRLRNKKGPIPTGGEVVAPPGGPPCSRNAKLGAQFAGLGIWGTLGVHVLCLCRCVHVCVRDRLLLLSNCLHAVPKAGCKAFKFTAVQTIVGVANMQRAIMNGGSIAVSMRVAWTGCWDFTSTSSV